MQTTFPVTTSACSGLEANSPSRHCSQAAGWNSRARTWKKVSREGDVPSLLPHTQGNTKPMPTPEPCDTHVAYPHPTSCPSVCFPAWHSWAKGTKSPMQCLPLCPRVAKRQGQHWAVSSVWCFSGNPKGSIRSPDLLRHRGPSLWAPPEVLLVCPSPGPLEPGVQLRPRLPNLLLASGSVMQPSGQQACPVVTNTTAQSSQPQTEPPSLQTHVKAQCGLTFVPP